MTLMARRWGRKSESATDRPTRPDTEPVEAFFKIDFFWRKNATLASKPLLEIAFFDAKLRFWPQQPPSRLTFFNAKMRSWPRMPSSRLHLSTQEIRFWRQKTFSKLHSSMRTCDSGLECLFRNCIFRRKNEIMASKAFFIIVLFDANIRFWSRMPSSKLHFSTQKRDSGVECLLQTCNFRCK